MRPRTGLAYSAPMHRELPLGTGRPSPLPRRRPLIRLGALLLAGSALSFFVGACGAPEGEIVFGITTEIPQSLVLTRVQASLTVDGSEIDVANYEGGSLDFPFEVASGLQPEGSRVELRLEGYGGGQLLVTRTAATTVMSDRKILLEVALEDECIEVECGAADTCISGSCADPLYHAAPLAYVMSVQSFGGTVVMMERFDAEQALALIEKYRVTHSQWVPTMFVRMMKLPEEARARHDLSSHQVAIHAAAPCPVEVKRQMIEWWGPILYEYYAGTEGSGSTFITSEDWLEHPGSVGRAALGVLHICDENGAELPVGETGLVYFERETPTFEYHNDPGKTADARHPQHPNWNALGDVGYLDADGYLYLTDRKSFMIISGGVNIYPQAIEDLLVTHPKVADVAVFGIPHPEMGEAVKAVIEPAPGHAPSDELAEELLAYAKERLAHYMAPRSIDFIEEMPRLPTGKLYKRLLRDAYWQDRKI